MADHPSFAYHLYEFWHAIGRMLHHKRDLRGLLEKYDRAAERDVVDERLGDTLENAWRHVEEEWRQVCQLRQAVKGAAVAPQHRVGGVDPDEWLHGVLCDVDRVSVLVGGRFADAPSTAVTADEEKAICEILTRLEQRVDEARNLITNPERVAAESLLAKLLVEPPDLNRQYASAGLGSWITAVAREAIRIIPPDRRPLDGRRDSKEWEVDHHSPVVSFRAAVWWMDSAYRALVERRKPDDLYGGWMYCLVGTLVYKGPPDESRLPEGWPDDNHANPDGSTGAIVLRTKGGATFSAPYGLLVNYTVRAGQTLLAALAAGARTTAQPTAPAPTKTTDHDGGGVEGGISGPVSPAASVAALTSDHERLLWFIYTNRTQVMPTTKLADLGPIRNRETVGNLCKHLAKVGLLTRPSGKNKGWAITDAGAARAELVPPDLRK